MSDPIPGNDPNAAYEVVPSQDWLQGWKPLPAVTNKVYNLATSARVARKRKVLDAWAAKLREIIAEPATELRLVA